MPEPTAPSSTTGHRADIKAIELQAVAAEQQVTAAWLRLVPTLSVSGAAFKQSVALPTGRDDGWRISIDLSWAIYDGGLRYGKQLQAQAQVEGARAALKQAKLRAAQEVTDATQQADVAREKLLLAHEQVRLASEAAASARRGLAGGIASSLDVREANDRLYVAEVFVANARSRVGSADAALVLATAQDPQ